MTAKQQVAELEYQLEQAMNSMRERDEEIEDLKAVIRDTEHERDEALAKLDEITKWASETEKRIDRALSTINDGVQEAIGENHDAFREMP